VPGIGKCNRFVDAGSERGLQIAAIAVANRLCVVTHNTKAFGRIEKPRVVDWALI
jgi:predicted nucleic acid-binding protein